MEPLYFGEKQELFGLFHSSSAFDNNETGIILCNPLGQEYIRCHRAMLKLAEKLTEKGFNVLRFDYYGCGDSQGNLDEVNSLSIWIDNIKTAMQELQAGCGVNKFYLIGIRFGATLSYICSEIMSAEKLVLWNPITDGDAYIKEISKHHKEWLDGSFAKTKGISSKFENLGFEFSLQMVEEIKRMRINLADIQTDTLVIGSNYNVLKTDKITCFEPVNHNFWLRKEGEMEKSLVPVQEINQIVNWLVN